MRKVIGTIYMIILVAGCTTNVHFLSGNNTLTNPKAEVNPMATFSPENVLNPTAELNPVATVSPENILNPEFDVTPVAEVSPDMNVSAINSRSPAVNAKGTNDVDAATGFGSGGTLDAVITPTP